MNDSQEQTPKKLMEGGFELVDHTPYPLDLTSISCIALQNKIKKRRKKRLDEKQYQH